MLKEKMIKTIGTIKLGAKRNAPELLLVGGLVAGTAAIVTAAKAALKHKELQEDLDVDVAIAMEDHGNDDPEVFEKEVKKLYWKYALDLTKNYAVPVALYSATIASVFASYKIQKNRQVALSTALAACTTAYTTLVNKLKTGAAAGLTAKEILDGVEAKEVVDPETGEVTYVKEQGLPIDTSVYLVRFDRYSPAWEKDKFQNECTLRSEENWANDRLRLQGYLFLNDVYDRLGLPRTQTGQMVGWIFESEEGDGFVDFGVVDCESYEDGRYDSNAFDLNFNVDGDILTKFNRG